MSYVSDLRDEVYTMLATKKSNTEFNYGNDFTLERTWRPYELLDKFAGSNPTGKVYVIGSTPIGYANQSRTNMVLGEYSVIVAFQRLVADLDDRDEIDSYVDFVQELEDACRTEINHPSFSFTRLEFIRDPDGLPLSFIMLRDASMFESYFTVYYNIVRP